MALNLFGAGNPSAGVVAYHFGGYSYTPDKARDALTAIGSSSVFAIAVKIGHHSGDGAGSAYGSDPQLNEFISLFVNLSATQPYSTTFTAIENNLIQQMRGSPVTEGERPNNIKRILLVHSGGYNAFKKMFEAGFFPEDGSAMQGVIMLDSLYSSSPNRQLMGLAGSSVKVAAVDNDSYRPQGPEQDEWHTAFQAAGGFSYRVDTSHGSIPEREASRVIADFITAFNTPGYVGGGGPTTLPPASTLNPSNQLPTATSPGGPNCAALMSSFGESGSRIPFSGAGSPSVPLTAISIPPATGPRSGKRRIRTTPTASDHGYDSTSLRNDVADRFEALRDALEARGAILTSAGGLRSLGAEVTVGRANLSLHYLGLAHDLATRSGVSSPDDPDKNPYIVERIPTDRSGKFTWHVWARATGGEERTINALHDRSGDGGSIVQVTARVVSLTNLAREHGITGIGNRSCYPGTYGCMEWWHLQCPDLIGDFKFGQLLQQVRDDDEISRSRLAQPTYFNAEWTGGYFRAA